MILFWFIIGMVLILAISRYNEDDKLFWKLFISFVGAFAAVTFVSKYIESQKKQDKMEYYQSAPTQALYSGSHVCVLADPSVTVTNAVAAAVPVSKEMLIDYTSPILSKVCVDTRGQPCEYFDDS